MLEEKGLSTSKFQMFYHFWNIINLHKILRIETLQVIEPFQKQNLTIEITMFPLVIFQEFRTTILSTIPPLTYGS
jgi:hypothetical protein